ncbi:hypothetical protein GCK32_021754 [Trichostrongylus colubriformis]|uniref:Uncharacterized protein n=1 Tax=Trichostrongylus colubriformis TaxID=6319 RepID=A0AAN8EU73_TRICO
MDHLAQAASVAYDLKNAFSKTSSKSPSSGLVGRNLKFTSVLELAKETCFVHRVPLPQWWMSLLPLVSELSDVED